ncbi:DUF3006 domain-containing protein [Vitiosangium sp. GDMCC 1.1324]|uniref:DUF3006 domain-containing protein n=1 Tax=Vitiosangium sp. (strain GDMCC 1.1324) TaxID=2138576 RepID=UPI000D3B3BEE|nr:DUF3006 domain-containing protein [Vitiosangium sp. GDMCC 1.1324]PTL77714.1 hypothetical protein DAT35_43805 [Vitiosangium sp. GDMCC 1.1324]
MMVGALGVVACGGASGAVQVEVLEDEVAQVVPVGGGKAYTVPRATLPPGAREGDVVREGRLDTELGARLAREVAEWRARLAVSVPDGLDLDSGASGSLTTKKEQ